MIQSIKQTGTKILIVTPPPTRLAGVANFYKILRPYFNENVDYFIINYSHAGRILKSFLQIVDIFRLVLRVLFKRYDVVLLNTSLGSTAVMRDGLYAFILNQVFHKKIYVHWHGWNLDYEKIVELHKIRRFRFFFFRAEKMFVLASRFKESLIRWGYDENRILLTTTAVEDSFCRQSRSCDIHPLPTVLFLARLEKEKGILLALEIIRILQHEKKLLFRTIVAGDGSALPDAKKFVEINHLQNVEFTGYVRGEDKENVFCKSDLYLFTSYGEGMPCSVLEAMASGLTVITSKVGGIPDFFENGKMGYIIDSFLPQDFAERMSESLLDPEILVKCGQYNRQYAEKHFTASQVAAHIQSVLESENGAEAE